jgi:serine/threonine protein kinase
LIHPASSGAAQSHHQELAAGLAAVHEKGLIHRDLKPSNVWLEAPSGRVKLLDFGLARDPRADDRVTNPGSVAGTPAYMSPEQVNGLALDARTDLFSLGSVLYKAATGRPAFAAPTMSAILAAVGEKEPVPARTVNPTVPVGLADLIERLHRKDPADRPASAAEVVEELRGLAADPEAPTTDWQSAGFEGTHRPGWSNRVRLAVSCTLGLLVVLGTILYAFVMNRPQEAAHDLSSARSEPAEPLRVRALVVLHLENFDDKKTSGVVARRV